MSRASDPSEARLFFVSRPPRLASIKEPSRRRRVDGSVKETLMQMRMILPFVALLALVGCGDDGPDQTGSADRNNPSTTQPANPPPGGAPAKPTQ